MRIAVIAHHRHPVAAPFMGGLEAYTHALVLGLMERGHDVMLFAPGDSDPALPLDPLVPRHTEAEFAQSGPHDAAALNAHVDAAFAAALERIAAGRFDAVHNDSLHRYPPRFARRDRQPMLTALHVPPFDALHRAVKESAGPWCGFTVTSQAQARVWWPEGPPPQAWVVPNGIDLSLWPTGQGLRSGAVWAGRITPNKGTHLAAAAAIAAGVPLTLCGPVEDAGYFARRVRPLLRDGVHHVGHVGQAQLAAHLSRAAVALFTPLWNEPFGLAAIEAMACGTPVAALGSGATAEVVGEAGAVVPIRFLDSAADLDPAEEPALIAALAAAIRQAMAVPPGRPRARVEALFTHARMLDRIEDLLARLIAARDAPAPPVAYPSIELP